MMRKSTRFTWWAAATIFTSAFLLFQVQPILSKMILPWFGGSPAVWSTCLLFFQLVLLAGYGYAHLLSKIRSVRTQVLIHTCLLSLSLLTLPISPLPEWRPTNVHDPVRHILFVLGACVGLPYLLLSSSGPLVQSWFSRFEGGREPYRLYALSNLGSLTALLGYPVFFEPRMTLPQQDLFWSIGFLVFAALGAILAWYLWRFNYVAETRLTPADGGEADVIEKREEPRWYHRIAWQLLPAVASTALLAVTNHLSRDIAAVPFLWVIPLSLYLLSFIFCFDSERWYRRAFFVPAYMATVLGLSTIFGISKLDVLAIRYFNEPASFSARIESIIARGLTRFGYGGEFHFSEFALDTWFHGGFYLVALFLGCMVCHGELASLRPRRKHITSFYLMVSAGGALGGFFVAIACPLLFDWFLELPLSELAIFVVCGVAAGAAMAKKLPVRPLPRWVVSGLGLMVVGLLVGDGLVRHLPVELVSTRVVVLLSCVAVSVGIALFNLFYGSVRSQTLLSGFAGIVVLIALAGALKGYRVIITAWGSDEEKMKNEIIAFSKALKVTPKKVPATTEETKVTPQEAQAPSAAEVTPIATKSAAVDPVNSTTKVLD